MHYSFQIIPNYEFPNVKFAPNTYKKILKPDNQDSYDAVHGSKFYNKKKHASTFHEKFKWIIYHSFCVTS